MHPLNGKNQTLLSLYHTFPRGQAFSRTANAASAQLTVSNPYAIFIRKKHVHDWECTLRSFPARESISAAGSANLCGLAAATRLPVLCYELVSRRGRAVCAALCLFMAAWGGMLLGSLAGPSRSESIESILMADAHWPEHTDVMYMGTYYDTIRMGEFPWLEPGEYAVTMAFEHGLAREA